MTKQSPRDRAAERRRSKLNGSPSNGDIRWEEWTKPLLAYLNEGPQLFLELKRKFPQQRLVQEMAWLENHGHAWYNSENKKWYSVETLLAHGKVKHED